MVDPKKIWNSPQLPTLPSVAVTLLELSRDPDADLREFVRAIKSDPALSAKILKAANSSYFAVRTQVTSIDRAVPLLGTTVVTSLALSFSLVEAAMTSGPLVEHYRRYWMQSVVQAVAAEMLSEPHGPSLACEYFLAGLLTDLGRLAMLKTIPREYGPVLETAQATCRDLHEVEREMLGTDHVEVGMRLIQSYRLPATLVEAVESHHWTVEQLIEMPPRSAPELRQAVAVAAAVGDYFCQPQKARSLERLRSLADRLYAIAERAADELLSRVKARVDESSSLFSIEAGELGEPGDLLAQANEQLAHLAMREHVATTQALARSEAVEREKHELESRARLLEKEATRDPLTGLYNRRYFDDVLERETGRCCRTAEPIAVLFADIDLFKRINDEHGHAFGDRVLQRTAKLLAEPLRKSDVLGRYGGEEFVILATQPTERGLEKVAERIRTRIEQEQFSLDGRRIPVTISLGAALAIPPRRDAELSRRLLAAADEAMYDSKRNGRNQVHLRLLCPDDERRLAQAVVQRRFSRWLVRRSVIDVTDATKALLQCRPLDVRIGILARQQHWLDTAAIEAILREQERTDERFGRTAIRLCLLGETQVALLLALQQEDPVSVASVLARTGLIDPQQASALVDAYFTEYLPSCTPGRLPSPPLQVPT